MCQGDLIGRFLLEDCDDSVRDLLLAEIESRSSGTRYLMFNVFNVRLDFDRGVATVEDELDPDAHSSTPLLDFARLLRSVGG